MCVYIYICRRSRVLAAALSSCIEEMERLTTFFLVVSAAFSLVAAAFTNESLHYLESVYGIANAAVPPNALMVGLTLIHGAAAKGAGISLVLKSPCNEIVF